VSEGDAVIVEGVVKRYGSHTAVEGLSFRVPQGVIYGMLGPNGAGKSTTLRMLNDIIAPDEGTIRLLGNLRPGREASMRIGYLPEERGLYPKMRVAAMLQFMAELRGVPAASARVRADEWLARLGLSAWAGNKIQELSKGMQQKVQFATALIHDPELVILDEPWSGLDPINAEVLRSTVLELRQRGRTVLFSTHLMEQAEQICDHVCIIARGRKILDGKLSEVKSAAAAERALSLGFADPSARARADETVLADRALVTAVRTPDLDAPDEVIVELAAGALSEQLLAALIGAGVRLRRFEVVTPSLHRIFIDRVGAEQARVAERREEPS
jgi:ABC-2 type transport system ATP-binding protein